MRCEGIGRDWQPGRSTGHGKLSAHGDRNLLRPRPQRGPLSSQGSGGLSGPVEAGVHGSLPRKPTEAQTQASRSLRHDWCDPSSTIPDHRGAQQSGFGVQGRKQTE